MKSFKQIIVSASASKSSSVANHYKQLAAHYEKLYLKSNHLYKHFRTQFAPGHFYSPYPNLKDLAKRKNEVFNREKRNIPGIDINEKKQLDLLGELKVYYKEFPYKEGGVNKKLRYKLGHHAYAHTDAVFLYSFMRYLKPKRIIEIGSGYSSALILDVNDIFLKGSVDITFVEPYPQLLKSMIKPDDLNKAKLISEPLHKIDLRVFDKLEKNDILFIDSTHVSKAGSDVNKIFFDILPRLKPGVIIHIHDVFYPFEYPVDWVWETRAWNEDYLLRAFLYNNNEYSILLFNNFLNIHHDKLLTSNFPLTKKNSGGSLWLRKTG